MNKNLHLAKVSFKTFTADKAVAIILMLLQIICCCALLFTYCFSMHFVNSSTGIGEYEFSYENGITYKEFNEKLSSFDNGFSNYQIYLDSDKIFMAAKMPYGVSKGLPINQNSGRNEIVIFEEDGENFSDMIGTTTEVFDKEYTIVGINRFYKNYEINLSSVSGEMMVFSVNILNEKIRNSAKDKKYLNDVQSHFGVTVTPHLSKDLSNLGEGAIVSLFLALGVAICLVSFAIGTKYILDRRQGYFKTLQIIGISKVKTFFWTLLEAVLVGILTYLTASIIYIIMDNYVFSKFVTVFRMPSPMVAEYISIGALYVLTVGLLNGIMNLRIYKRRKL